MVKTGPNGILGYKQINPNTLAHIGIFFQYLTSRNKAINHNIIAIHMITTNISKKVETISVAKGLTVPVVGGGVVITIEKVGTGVVSDLEAEIVAS